MKAGKLVYTKKDDEFEIDILEEENQSKNY